MSNDVTVSIVVQGIEHTLRGARAKRFADLLNKRMEDDPMIQWQSRPQQRAVHEAIFREVIQKGNDNG